MRPSGTALGRMRPPDIAWRTRPVRALEAGIGCPGCHCWRRQCESFIAAISLPKSQSRNGRAPQLKVSLRRSCLASHAMGVRQPGNSNLLRVHRAGNRGNPRLKMGRVRPVCTATRYPLPWPVRPGIALFAPLQDRLRPVNEAASICPPRHPRIAGQSHDGDTELHIHCIGEQT